MGIEEIPADVAWTAVIEADKEKEVEDIKKVSPPSSLLSLTVAETSQGATHLCKGLS